MMNLWHTRPNILLKMCIQHCAYTLRALGSRKATFPVALAFAGICIPSVLEAQTLKPAPKLVVNIIIDQLRSDYIDLYSPFYAPDGFRRLLDGGSVYELAECPFSPVDMASATAAVATGTTPQYNNIVASQWLDRESLTPVNCTLDDKNVDTPQKMIASTIGDELKIATRGMALVYSVALDKEMAILAGGHAANGAFWVETPNVMWGTSAYYPKVANSVISAYAAIEGATRSNEAVARLGAYFISNMGMGLDPTTDLLCVGLSAKVSDSDNWQAELEEKYRQLDYCVAKLINTAAEKVGLENTLFILTGTGSTSVADIDYSAYKVPTGTFYINRTANLLNMFLGAIYGMGKYVECCYHNQIYLNRKLIEDRTINMPELMARAKEFLVQNQGVMAAHTSPYNPAISGDLIVEVAPGWNLLNEETGEHYTNRASYVPFPIVLFGSDIQPARHTDPVNITRIAPTIAKALRVNAPNACTSPALQ